MGYHLKITVPFLFITVAALYGMRRRKLAGNRMDSCKGSEIGSSQKQLRQAPEGENEMDSGDDGFLNEVDDTSKKNCSILVDKDSLSLPMTDRLSELPDDILSHIITYLSLGDVATLATLSENLRKVSLSLRCLDLDWDIMSGMPSSYHYDDKCELYKQAYVNGVERVLQNYKDQNIVSYRLHVCCLDNKHAVVNKWINSAAIYKGLESLTLHFACWDNFSKVDQRTYNVTHVISGSFLSQFSFLKNLHLHSCIVRVENGDFRLSNLLTSLDLCDVILEGTQWQSFLSSLSSTLERLSLRSSNLPEKLCIDDHFSSLSFLRILLCDECELQISARNLKTFEFVFFAPVECSFSYASSLETVYMSYGRQDHTAVVILESLAAKALNLKSLTIRGSNYLVHKQPSCKGLLFRSVLSFCFKVREDNNDVLKAFPHLLKSFPLLKKLDIEFLESSAEKMYKDPIIPYHHDNLKEVKLGSFHERWISVAIFLLQSAIGLNCMMITKSSRRYRFFDPPYIREDKLSEKECEIIQKALKGKASSPHAQIIIEQVLSSSIVGHGSDEHEGINGTTQFGSGYRS